MKWSQAHEDSQAKNDTITFGTRSRANLLLLPTRVQGILAWRVAHCRSRTSL